MLTLSVLTNPSLDTAARGHVRQIGFRSTTALSTW